MGIFSLFLAIQNVLVLMTDLGLNVALVNYVARGDGTSVFSRTLEEHNRAVAKYQLHR